MADSGIGLGDFPAWIALAISVGSALRQWTVNKKTERERIAFEAKAVTERKGFQQKIRIEELAKDIEELRALSLDYWTKPGSETASSGLMMNIKTKDISSRTWSYRSFLWQEAGSDFSNLKRLITGGSFQSASRVALPHNSQTIRDMLDAFSSFREKIRAECDKIDIA